ncbi:hypothetical protein [Pseudomonas fluorescens]|nr:hypothetical protein [Pseudomonas fluorescens]
MAAPTAGISSGVSMPVMGEALEDAGYQYQQDLHVLLELLAT